MSAIEVSDLFCLYPVPGSGTVAALRGLSLHLSAGERVVVHGPNGSGKTTLLRVLTGEVAPSAGLVSVAGVELSRDCAAGIVRLRRELVGIVDQYAARTLRPELTVRDNVALQLRLAGRPRTAARASAAAALDELGLGHLGGRRSHTLSGGEAQRVAVCAAIAHDPVVILADEPTGELDLGTADAVYDLLEAAAARSGAALLLVSHDARAGRVADRVVRIRDGRLSEEWDPRTPTEESLVVDDRGWLRLPEPVRHDTGLGERVRLSRDRGRLWLRPAGDHVQRSSAKPPSVPAPEVTAGEGTVRLRALRKSYGTRRLYGDTGLDLDIDGPGVTVVRGRSGAGKSTLLQLLLGLADPDSGSVVLGGIGLRALSRADRAAVRRRCVGVALQGGSLGETLDARENLRLARSVRGLPDMMAADAWLAALGLEAIAGRQARLLSGGERQRLLIARALVVGRPLTVLDEPTSQQDEAHAELLTQALAAAARAGGAVVCATHDPVLAEAADHVVELA